MPFFISNNSGNILEVDSPPIDRTSINCSNIEEARELFKKLQERFPKGKGLLDRLMEIPFED